LDADIEVVGPAELKDAFAHLARRYANAATEDLRRSLWAQVWRIRR
jgi:hypothetical protein